MKSYIITLIDDKLRLDNAVSQMEIHNVKDYEIFEAFDGKKLGLKDPNKKLNQNMMGCFLSHLSIWKKAIKNKEKYACIMEDDVSLPDGFQKKFEEIIKDMPKDGDIYFLGWYSDKTPSENKWTELEHSWGTHCYIINVKNLKKKINLFENLYDQIDMQIMDLKRKQKIKIYHLSKKITHQIGITSTIQYGYLS